MATQVVKVVCALASFTVGHAFVQPKRLAGLPAEVPSSQFPSEAVLRNNGYTANRRRSTSPSAAPAFAFGALIVSAAVMRSRSRRVSVERRVTMEQIENLTIADMPPRWRSKISLGMARRDQLVQAIKQELDDTFFVMAFNKDGMPTDQLEQARGMFPPTVRVCCLKNSLVKKAMAGTEWEPLAAVLKGPNMYVFVKQDTDLKETIKSYLAVNRQFNREGRVAELYEKIAKQFTFVLKPLVGGMMRDEWTVISPEDLPKFKDFPTKTELIAKIAGSIKQVTTKVASGVKQVPQKLAIGTKKVVEKMEEDGKATVSEVVA